MSAPEEVPKWLESIDHTADVGICVRAPSLEQLFARAAWAMFSVITDMDSVRVTQVTRVAVEADDRGKLLVRWLSELNYLHVTNHRLFCRFDILSLSDQRLEAEIGGELIQTQRHTIHTEIKAVTFHELLLAHDDRGWKARIIFDV